MGCSCTQALYFEKRGEILANKKITVSEEWVFCFTGYRQCFANLVKLLQQSC